MKDKLIELMNKAMLTREKDRLLYGEARLTFEELADHLIANGVTVQTTPISYKRLLKLAKKMHTWIFLNTGDEQKVYDELGITEEENYVFGYGGKIEVPYEAPKEEI